MATWHQLRKPVRLFHPTQWTVVDDPPGCPRGLMSFGTKSAAEQYVERRRTLGTGQHCYVLAPATNKES